MGLGLQTRLIGLVEKLAPRTWYNIQLLNQFARSGFFGLYPARHTAARFLEAVRPVRLSENPNSWLDAGAINGALKSDGEVTDTLHKLYRLRLYPHPGREKNWDAFRAFSFILAHGSRRSAVLDMGSSTYGRILPWLHLYGFSDLHGCDLSFPSGFKQGGIRFMPQNLEGTSYSAGRFDFITCLSVIEHGVDLHRYFDEARRLLKSGGHLLTSTDYWCEPIVADGLYDPAYHCPVKVYSPQDVTSLLDIAAIYGFEPLGEIDYSCGSRLAYWERFDLRFTFFFLALQKNPGSCQ